mgnify:CR=1 FL=1
MSGDHDNPDTVADEYWGTQTTCQLRTFKVFMVWL